MNNKSEIKTLIEKLEAIYSKGEAEGIAKLVFEKITAGEPGQIKKITDRLLKNEPVQYVLNESWFFNLPFYVDRNVLIPRQETEELVEWVIKENKYESPSILDVGTGSGCIAVTLKKFIPAASLWGCDISAGALSIAEKNAETLKARVNFVELDFLDPKQRDHLPHFDIIISNPPYIPVSERAGLPVNVRDFEPASALFTPDNDPLIFYKALADFAVTHMAKEGMLYAEIHENLSENVRSIWNDLGFLTEIKKDMQGKNRMIRAILR
jgi:release factor glutamine methyltransferase